MTPGAGAVVRMAHFGRVAREGASRWNAAPQGIRQDSLLEKCPDLLKIRSLAGFQALSCSGLAGETGQNSFRFSQLRTPAAGIGVVVPVVVAYNARLFTEAMRRLVSFSITDWRFTTLSVEAKAASSAPI